MAKNNDPNTLNLKVSMDASEAKKEIRSMLAGLNDISKSLNAVNKDKKTGPAHYMENANKYISGFSNKMVGINTLTKQLSSEFNKVSKNVASAITTGKTQKLIDYSTEIETLTKNLRQLSALAAKTFAIENIVNVDSTTATAQAVAKLEEAYKGFGTNAKESAEVLAKEWNKVILETNEQTKMAYQEIDRASQFVGKSAESSAQVFAGAWMKALPETVNATKTAYEEIDKARNSIEKSAKESASVFVENDFFREQEKQESKQRQASLDFDRLTSDKSTLKTSEAIAKLEERLEQAKQKFFEMREAGQNTKGIERSISATSKKVRKLQENGRKADGVFKKLWGRIRNISIYRAIRTVLKEITQGFQEGINNFVQFDESANATMSNINGSLQQIRNTMGIAMVSALQALEPIIISASNALINLLDAFNIAMAKMSGKTTYNKAIKNVDDYAASVDKAKGSLADFDKFRTLDVEQTDPTEMFSEEKIDENESRASKFFESIINFIKQIWTTISTVWRELTDLGIWDILIDVFGVIADSISFVVMLVAKLIKGLQEMGMLKGVLYGLVIAWGAYKVATMAAAAANAAAWMMAHPILGGVILTGALATLTGIISSFSNITSSNITSGGGFATVGLADGGFTTANFIATNENGVREWVGSNGSATAVVNDTQMSDIMYQAVKDGCYEGVVDALSDANSYSATNNDNSVATVEIQGETLFTIVRNVAQKQGLKFSRV